MKYCCEHCGKSFVKEEEAIACEKQHKAEQERNEKLKAEKNKHYFQVGKDRINDAIKKLDTNQQFLYHYTMKLICEYCTKFTSVFIFEKIKHFFNVHIFYFFVVCHSSTSLPRCFNLTIKHLSLKIHFTPITCVSHWEHSSSTSHFAKSSFFIVFTF